MPAVLRSASSQDAQNLAALAIQVWLHTYATDGIRNALSEFVFAEFTKDHFLQRLADPAHGVLVAEIDGHLVGYADLDFESPREEILGTHTELATLYVQEHFAGKGIGSQLLAASSEQALQRCGSPAFWLSVYHRNDRAIAFYQRHGFSTRGSFFFEFGGERHKNLVLARTPA